MRQAYLTIDDSPSARTDDLVDALSVRGVPAILYCRGDLLEANPAPIIRAIQKGFAIGNHGYWHKRASILGFAATTESIDKTDALIEQAYTAAGVRRPGKYYRFAYMDRGMGAWFVEPDTVPEAALGYVESMIRDGLGNDPYAWPDDTQIEMKSRLQNYLREKNYTQAPFKNVAHPFYAQSEMATAIDGMFTFSTADWAITARHKGKYGFDTVDDLKANIDKDVQLARNDTAHIILAHDQAEIHDAVIALIDHMIDTGLQFKEIA